MMVSITIQVEDEVYEVMEVLAEMRGVTVQEILQTITIDEIARIRSRINDPLVGALGPFVTGGGVTDTASNADDIIAQEWEPD
jgi:hypothetical protein